VKEQTGATTTTASALPETPARKELTYVPEEGPF